MFFIKYNLHGNHFKTLNRCEFFHIIIPVVVKINKNSHIHLHYYEKMVIISLDVELL